MAYVFVLIIQNPEHDGFNTFGQFATFLFRGGEKHVDVTSKALHMNNSSSIYGRENQRTR